MALADLTKTLAEQLGIAGFEPEPDGNILIEIDDDYFIEISPDEDRSGFVVTSTVAPLPAKNREAVFETLLAANLEGRGAGGAALSIDQTLQEIVLTRSFPDEQMDYPSFEAAFAAFGDALIFWRERANAGELAEAAAATADDAPDAHTLRV